MNWEPMMPTLICLFIGCSRECGPEIQSRCTDNAGILPKLRLHSFNAALWDLRCARDLLPDRAGEDIEMRFTNASPENDPMGQESVEQGPGRNRSRLRRSLDDRDSLSIICLGGKNGPAVRKTGRGAQQSDSCA